MKKKLLALLLALGMGLTLAACSSGGENFVADQNPGADNSDAVSSPGAGEESTAPTGDPAENESDLAYVKDKGTLVVGITNFEPMDYQDTNGQWIGFDADMAKAFAASLGVEVEFSEITWDYKVFELEAKNIDCVWNGMTLNDE